MVLISFIQNQGIRLYVLIFNFQENFVSDGPEMCNLWIPKTTFYLRLQKLEHTVYCLNLPSKIHYLSRNKLC